MDDMGGDTEKVWTLGWEHFHRESGEEGLCPTGTIESEGKDDKEKVEKSVGEGAAKERVQNRVGAMREQLTDCQSDSDYIAKIEALHETEDQRKEIILEQTKKLSQGHASIISKIYIAAFILKGKEYMPSPQGFFAAATYMDEMSGEEKESIQRAETAYNRKLFAFHLRFMQEYGAQIPLPVWEEFLSNAIVAIDIDPAIATAMGYDLAKLNQ